MPDEKDDAANAWECVCCLFPSAVDIFFENFLARARSLTLQFDAPCRNLKPLVARSGRKGLEAIPETQECSSEGGLSLNGSSPIGRRVAICGSRNDRVFIICSR